MTLRELSNKTDFSLAQWTQIAKLAGVTVAPDAELTSLQSRAIKETCRRYLLQKQRAERQQQLQKQQEDKVPPVSQSSPEVEPEQPADDGASVSDKEAAAIQAMDRWVRENEIFVDISSMISFQSELTFPHLIPVLKNHGKKLRIPESVIQELNQYATDESDQERAGFARKSLDYLRELQGSGLIDIRKSVAENSSPARDLLTSCAHFRLIRSLLVITQSKELAEDIISLNGQRSAEGFNITVKKFNKYGYLSNVYDPPRTSKPPRNDKPYHKNNNYGNSSRPFYIATQVRQEPDQQLTVTTVPKAGDTVYIDPRGRGAIHLTERCNEGGEGIIYFTDYAETANGSEVRYVAKIYKADRCTSYRQEKITRMVSAGLQYRGICFPKEALYNAHGEFVGYLMQEARGETLQNSVFRKLPFLRKFPGWKKADLVQLAITILFKIKYIHDNGLLLGDINPNNIMVVSPEEVYLVDTDSYQVNDLPCQVGVVSFTAPELLQSQRNGEFKEFSEILRTRASEDFAVATLLFMLMMPGKPPYSHTGGENIADNILLMHFPYALGERGSDKAPDGAWRYIWSHLRYQLKVKFHQTFTKQEGKSDFNMKERVRVDYWLNEMREYLAQLQRVQANLDEYHSKIKAGILDERNDPPPEDEQDLMIYPTRLKWERDKETRSYILKRCVCCNEWAPVNGLRDGYCYTCRHKGDTLIKCQKCGASFVFPDYERDVKKRTPYKYCRDCRNADNEVVYDEECATPGCFNRVTVTRSVADVYASKGMEFPRTCKVCTNTKPFGKYAPRGNRRDDQGGQYNKSKPDQSKPAAPDQSKPAAPAQTKPAAPVQTKPTAVSPSKPAVTPSSHSTTTTQPKSATAPRVSPASHPKKSSGSSGCFITTAVCDYYGKPDDCQELMDFRGFRDNWLRFQPGGEELIREYYECAPELVRRMRASADFGAICREIREDFLLPCQRMIHENQLEACRDHYTAMVHHLRVKLNCE